MTSKRTLVLFLLIGLLAAGVSWAAPKQVSLTVWTHTHAPANAYITKLIAQFLSRHPNYTISYEPAADNDTYESKLLAALASGGGPDIFNTASFSDMYTFAGLGQLQEITPQILKDMGYASAAAFKSDYVPGIIDKLYYDGKLYGLYREFNIFGLMLNKLAFKRAGLDATKDYPKTWDQMLSLAKKLTIYSGDKLVQTGMYEPLWNADWTLIPIQPLLIQNGGSILDKAGTASAIDGPGALKTFTYFRQLARAQNNAPVKVPEDVWARFSVGDVAMYVGSTWTMPLLKDSAKGDARFSPDNFVVVPYPKLPGADRVHAPIQALAWCVNHASQSPSEAWQFVQWMTSGPQAIGWYNEVGYLLPTKAMMDMARQNADVAKFMNLANDADLLFAHPKYNEIGSAVFAAWQATLTTDKDLKTVLGDAAQQINETLAH
jgi:ABC-type glycerol-3-phosphate transport system substrate-binding protein